MSDVYIPGLKSRFNSEKLIEDLMKVERIPKEKLEQNIDNFENRKTWWRDLGDRVDAVRESARMLFSFQNPFSERAAVSSNENIITVTATREADEREYQFSVKQLAQADRFLSRPLDEKATTVEAGEYAFSIGREEIAFNFKGGSLKEFADAVNRRGNGKLNASLLTIQPGSRSLLLESKVTGTENRLGFSGDSLELAVRLGIVERINNSPVEIAAPASAGEDADSIGMDENTGAEDTAAAGNVVAAGGNAAAAFRPLNAASTAQDAVIAMEGIEMIRPSNVINDIIPGVTITAKGVSERPERLEIQTDREGVKNAIISLVANYNRLMAEINVLTAKRIASTSGAEAKTMADDSIIRELTYLTADEAAAMRERLGAFNGEGTITQLKDNLRRAVSVPYPTDDGRELALLAQIGIGTNVNGSGGMSYSASQMRGYLDIDEKKLNTAIERQLPAVRQLFGSDTDGDLLADTGIAFNIDTISRPFLDRGGIISLKTGAIDSKISQDKRRIETMERQLIAKEADLKIQYSRMESAYARMEQMSSALDNFSQRNNNSR